MNQLSARPDHLLTLSDGSHLALDEHGATDPAAPVVLFLHSSPGSRVLDPDPAATAAAGVRLLTVDRPGYGASTPWPEDSLPTVAAGADKVAEALAQLGVTRCSVVGWSAGGRTALALGALHPDLVARVVLVGTPAPDDEVPWISDEHRELGRAMRADPTHALATVLAAFGAQDPGVADGPQDDAAQDPSGLDVDGTLAAGGPAAEDPLLSMIAAGPADERIAADPARRAAVTAMLLEAFAQGPAGVAADIVADHVAPWGFELDRVVAPVICCYGEQDPLVPPTHGAWYADRVARATEWAVPDVGHLLVLTEWRRILDALT
jgi:pimeloyl-ACP methyl ester carboxylesterase